MHPVNYLFKDIYRDHWGIPLDERPSRNRRDAPAWQRAPRARSEFRKSRAVLRFACAARGERLRRCGEGRTGKLGLENA